MKTPNPRRDPRLPGAGSTLVRKYRGQDLRVLVLDDGFEWDGRRFDSLSEVAFAGWISVEDGMNGMDELRRSVAFLKQKRTQYYG